ncbi:MAG: DUF11 domain-containing protein [Ardenticatenales bacterium]|nr:DUF11 domain-containing protein [Ardenticatenales bacterium]
MTCTGIDVAAFGEARFQLAFTISPSFVATAPTGDLPISNTACVVVVNFIDPDLTNNCDTETDLVKDLADLRVTKFVESTHNPVRAGEIFTYTIYVDNLGPSVARNVTITDTFLSSNSVSIQSCAFSVSQGGGAITQFTCTTGNVVSTQFGSDIGTFSTNRLDPVGVVGSPPPSGGHQGRLRASFRLVARTDLQTTNTVRAHALTPDPNTSNNLATVELRAESVADLSVTKSAEGEEQQVNQPGLMFNNAIFNQPFPTGPNYFVSTRVTAGRRIHYQVTVRNNGPSVAENVVLYDRLPAGVRFYQGSLIVERSVPNGLVTVLPTPCATGTPGIALDKMTCGLGSLLVGQSMFINFQVVTDANLAPGAILENDAWTTSDTLDISNVNNYGFTQNTVLAAADMGVSKSAVGQVVTAYNAPFHQFIVTDVANQVTAGKVLRYQIQVQNNGPSDGRNVTIQENLPAAPVPGPVTFLRADGASCRPDSVNQQLLFCDLGDMVAGARETFDLYVLVDPSVPTGTLLTNTATALQSGSNVVPPGASPAIPGVDPTRPITWDPCVACGPTGNANAAVNLTTATAVADVSVEKVDVPADAALDRPFEPDLAIAGNEHRYQITIGNNGPSTAVNVGVRDLLDFKQPGILGETFVRCEPIDPDDIVTCSLTLPNTVTVTRLQVGNEAVIPTAGTGTLVPNRQYGFYLITRVDAGYVLDGTDLLAEDTATISSSTTDFRFQNNTDRHQTLITAEADLSLTKADDAAGFLTCDPVAPGGTITYDLVVTNNGPADAADVYVVDQLPANFVAVDPALVNVIVSRGQVIEVRDDGWITIRVGNDVNNSGTTELGRVNAGSAPVTIRITTTVRLDAACGQQAANTARVETRRNDAPRGLTGGWPPAPQPFPGIDGGPRTPTIDPNGANNAAVALTTIECPRIQVIKTVSFDGKCPGVNISAGVFNQTGQPITFCFEVTNTGTTFLDDIFLSDVLDTRTMEPTEIYSDTITSGADPNTPLKPGETVNRKVTVDHALLKWDCGEITDTVTVTANPVNSGRTDLPCLDDVTDDDTAVIDVPCAGVDWRLQLPVLGGPTCPTLVQVQNLGRKDTKVILVVWGEESFCPPQAAGPLKVECGGLLRPGSSWTFTASQLPSAARSAVLYSVNATDIVMNVDGNESRFDLEVCDALMTHVVGNWKQWSVFDLAYRRQRVYRSPFDGSGLHQIVLDFKAHQGEPIAATVNRSCPDAADPNVMSNAVYTGISSDQEGARDPVSGARMFYAPLVFAGKGGLSSKVCIQNSGDECTSLELWFKGQDECLRNTLADVLTLSPGETVCFDPATVVGPDWLGSAHIRSTQPLGIVVDTMGPNHFHVLQRRRGRRVRARVQCRQPDRLSAADILRIPGLGHRDSGPEPRPDPGGQGEGLLPRPRRRHHHDAGGLGLPAWQPDVLPARHRQHSRLVGGQRARRERRVDHAGRSERPCAAHRGRGAHGALERPGAHDAARGDRLQRTRGVPALRLAARQRHGRDGLRRGRAGVPSHRQGQPRHRHRTGDHEPRAEARLHGLRAVLLRPERPDRSGLPEGHREAGRLHRSQPVRLPRPRLPRQRRRQRRVLGARRVRRPRPVRAQRRRPGSGGDRTGRNGRLGRRRPAGRRVEGLRGVPGVRYVPAERSAAVPGGAGGVRGAVRPTEDRMGAGRQRLRLVGATRTRRP